MKRTLYAVGVWLGLVGVAYLLSCWVTLSWNPWAGLFERTKDAEDMRTLFMCFAWAASLVAVAIAMHSNPEDK